MKSLFVIMCFFIMIFPSKAQTRFIWPVKAMPAYSEVADFYTVNNFVDQNSAAASIQDWNCAPAGTARTYDGHGGVDIDLWPFYWSMMDNDYVAVVAAANGRVVVVTDNQNNESNCGQAGENNNGNFIAIRHADSSTSFYIHIRTNSARVAVGDIVTAGQVIAIVGGSGNSSNPHLHFEVNSTAVTNTQAAGLIDPYTGTCNTLNAATWWLNQKPYWEPAVVRVMTHRIRPVLAGYNGNSNTCRTGESKNARADFGPNDSIYFGVAMRDFLQNQSYTLSVYGPGGGLWFSESRTNTGNNVEAQYNVHDRRLPANSLSGTYKVEVSFNNTTRVYFFSVNCPTAENIAGTITGYKGFKASSLISISASMESGNRLFLQSGTTIKLLPGFVAKDGSILKARIRDCNYSE